MKNYKELEELAKWATPGPWATDDPYIVYAMNGKEVVYLAKTLDLDTTAAKSFDNAAFIAAANPAVVLELIETQRVLVEAVRDMLEGWRYIRSTHGDLYGVGWDRAQDKAEAAYKRATGE